MNVQYFFSRLAAGLLSVSAASTLIAAEEPAKPADKPAGEEVRKKIENLTPAEREAKIRELRERRGPAGSTRQEWEKFREEIKDLSPELRSAKMKEWREKHALSGPSAREELRNATPEQRAARMKEWRERLEKRVAGLRKKQTAGAISEDEQRQLERMEQMIRRLDEHKQRIESTNAPGPKLSPARPAAGADK